METDWQIYGEWNDIPNLAIDSWNGYFNNSVHQKLLGGFMKALQFWKDNKLEIMYASKSS